MKVTIYDRAPLSTQSLKVKIEADGIGVSILPEGYGDCGSANGHGCPVYIEFYEGHLRVVAFPDILSEEPVIIDLEGARESLRKD